MFFFSATATTEIYTLSLHDALPILHQRARREAGRPADQQPDRGQGVRGGAARSEEHTSELQSRFDLVCRLLLEKKNAACRPTSRTNVPLASRHTLSPQALPTALAAQ